MMIWIVAVLGAALGSCHSPSPRKMTDQEAPLNKTGAPLLVAPPMVGRPTESSVALNIVAGQRPLTVSLEYGKGDVKIVHEFSKESGHQNEESLNADEVLEVQLDGLEPSSIYHFALSVKSDGEEQEYEGRFVTQRIPGESFTVGIATDSHLPIPAPTWLDPQTDYDAMSRRHWVQALMQIGSVLRRTMEGLKRHEPDFVVFLGDMIDLRVFGFNGAFPDDHMADFSYRLFRSFLDDTQSRSAFYAVIGNWEGENGDLSNEEISRARRARMKLLPNPLPTTYPKGGNEFEDYFAWSWGDADFIVLNVMTYTKNPHTLGNSMDEGTASDWTLGEKQMSWLKRTLAACERKHRIVFIHHAVGGAGGDELNAAYGRGGGLAAKVGEQEALHELMIEYGVQVMFYGHDHVFTDIVVDEIHYTLTGACGAPWKFDTDETGYTDYDKRSGYTLLHVSKEKLRVEFLGLDNKVFRHYEVGTKR